MYDYSNLKGKIVAVYGTQKEFANEMKLSHTSLSNKLTNKVDFSQSEIDKAIMILGIPKEDVCSYFFTHKVENK